MATFLLVHGGLHGGWCWEHLVPLLEQAGHSALAPDLPGMGADTTPPADVTLDLWSDFIVDLARAEEKPPILVGHSRAGVLISEAAERAPDAVAGLVYCTAMLLQDGDSMMDAHARLMPQGSSNIVLSDDGLCSSLDPSVAVETFYNTTDPAIAARAVSRIKPEPIKPNVTPIHVTPGRYGRVPRAFIECTQDNAIPLAVQRAMQAELPCTLAMTLNTDHSPFLSDPKRLARALIEIAQHWGPPAGV